MSKQTLWIRIKLAIHVLLGRPYFMVTPEIDNFPLMKFNGDLIGYANPVKNRFFLDVIHDILHVEMIKTDAPPAPQVDADIEKILRDAAGTK